MSSEPPILEFTSSELGTQTISQESLARACTTFTKQGFLVLRNVLDPEFVQAMHRSFIETNSEHFKESSSEDALDVGHKRKMITVEIKPPFDTETLYANPFFYPIIEKLLGADCILGSFGSVTSMPGSKMQGIHYDHPHLFNDDEFDDEEIEGIMDKLPPFAITVVIPLVPITQENGATRMWPGSHLAPRKLRQAYIDSDNYMDPYAELGDCIIFDYRLLHAGMPNKSEQVRPILYNIYFRPWFRDVRNYEKQAPLNISEENYKKVPDQHLKLFNWAMDKYWSVDLARPIPVKDLPRNSPCYCGSGKRYKHCHGKLN